MNNFKEGNIRKCKFINEFGVPLTIYISDVLKKYNLNDLVSQARQLQLVQFPDGNYCLVPCENVELDLDKSKDDIELSRPENLEDVLDASCRVKECWPLRDFVKMYRTVQFGYSFNTIDEEVQTACFFLRRDKSGTVVFNPNNITFKQMVENTYYYFVVKMRSGHYFLKDRSGSFSRINFSQDPRGVNQEYDLFDIVSEGERKQDIEEQKKRKKEIQRQIDRNRDRFPYDLSGDDLSLDSRMW